MIYKRGHSRLGCRTANWSTSCPNWADRSKLSTRLLFWGFLPKKKETRMFIMHHNGTPIKNKKKMHDRQTHDRQTRTAQALLHTDLSASCHSILTILDLTQAAHNHIICLQPLLTCHKLSTIPTKEQPSIKPTRKTELCEKTHSTHTKIQQHTMITVTNITAVT